MTAENAQGQQNQKPANPPQGQAPGNVRPGIPSGGPGGATSVAPGFSPGQPSGNQPRPGGHRRRRRRNRRNRPNGGQPGGQQLQPNQQQNRQNPGQPNRQQPGGRMAGRPGQQNQQRFQQGQRPQSPQNRFPGKPPQKPKVYSPELRDIPIPPELLQPVIEKPFYSLVKPVQPGTAQDNATSPQNEIPADTQPADNSPSCPVCSMPVRSLLTSLKRKEDGAMVHFDCALRDLATTSADKLGRFRKIYYVGGGNFAVVKEVFDKRGRFKSYEVIEKIPYEPKEK